MGVVVAAISALVLVAFATAMALQAQRIGRERDRANREAETAKYVSDFLVGLFNVSDPSEARGNTLTAKEKAEGWILSCIAYAQSDLVLGWPASLRLPAGA